MANQGSKKTDSRLFFVATTAVSALVGSHAMDLGKLVIRLGDKFQGKPTRVAMELQAGLVTVAIGFAFLLIIGARKSLEDGDPGKLKETIAAVIVGIIGGTFAVLEVNMKVPAAAKELPTQLAIIGVFVALFLIPIWIRKWETENIAGSVELFMRMAIGGLIALLLAGLVGLSIKWVGENCVKPSCTQPLNAGYLAMRDSSFLISNAPVAGLLAAWAILTADPLVSPWRWRGRSRRWYLSWLTIYLVVACSISVFYGSKIYFDIHALNDQNGWLRDLGVTRVHLALWFIGLQTVPIAVCVIALVATKPGPKDNLFKFADLFPVMGCGVAVCVSTYLIAHSIINFDATQTQAFNSEKFFWFVSAHTAIAVCICVGVLVSHRFKTPSRTRV